MSPLGALDVRGKPIPPPTTNYSFSFKKRKKIDLGGGGHLYLDFNNGKNLKRIISKKPVVDQND